MRKVEYTSQFKRDLKKAQKRGKNMEKIKEPLRLLIEEEPLPPVYGDHSLTGNWSGCRDLHIEPDWLLIYRVIGNLVRFERTGSHSDLFR
ncbi:MAG: type II toxin-antitoxin system YafQ family toxin [Proteobacteria bacterium]|nr:type II toxin-antitoxin system YafQ family toxin [Pseudomonadota bacterium]